MNASLLGLALIAIMVGIYQIKKVLDKIHEDLIEMKDL